MECGYGGKILRKAASRMKEVYYKKLIVKK